MENSQTFDERVKRLKDFYSQDRFFKVFETPEETILELAKKRAREEIEEEALLVKRERQAKILLGIIIGTMVLCVIAVLVVGFFASWPAAIGLGVLFLMVPGMIGSLTSKDILLAMFMDGGKKRDR